LTDKISNLLEVNCKLEELETVSQKCLIDAKVDSDQKELLAVEEMEKVTHMVNLVKKQVDMSEQWKAS